ncbi:MAG: glutamate racemase [Anaerolineales bacterium]|nr:glutamate racemase [Anaerolineales bacterium]
MRINKHHRPIGIYDSGVGGLSVLREIHRQYPHEDCIYIADQIHVPYGTRSREQVLEYSEGIVRYLLSRGSKIIVVACNTASAVALAELRKIYPDIPFVGMEPAVKPAAEGTSSGVVGVLATPATFQGDLYASTVEKFARGVKILQDTCPGLVSQIEKGKIDHPDTRSILENALIPMLEEGVDEVVIGCTHYPFVIPIIREIVGEKVRVIDPAPAVARQAGRLLENFDLVAERNRAGEHQFLTTGDPEKMKILIRDLINTKEEVDLLVWDGGDIQADQPD